MSVIIKRWALLFLILFVFAGCQNTAVPGPHTQNVKEVEKTPAENRETNSGGKMEQSAWRNFTKPSDAALRNRLSFLQYWVTQREGTEPPFENRYWDEKRDGIYVDIVSGEPLFSSLDKYDSKTGWPSFTKPLDRANIVTREDRRLFPARIEVTSKRADSHLGHVFTDGPPPGGLRYCMNSAAMRFVPKEDLEKEGYGEYRKIFDQN